MLKMFDEDIDIENTGETRQSDDKTWYYLNFKSNVLQVRCNLQNITAYHEPKRQKSSRLWEKIL